jgi:transcriptional regulator with XRE-family HTH domain
MSAFMEKSMTETLKPEFQDEDYRYAYDEEFSNSRMATQIKVIREQRKLKQVELADLAEMKQSRISALEDVNYSAWSISTLRRLARALGVRLSFKFEGWGELLPEIEDFGRKSLEKPKFEDDTAFKDEPVEDAESMPDLEEIFAALGGGKQNNNVTEIKSYLEGRTQPQKGNDLYETLVSSTGQSRRTLAS